MSSLLLSEESRLNKWINSSSCFVHGPFTFILN